MINSYPIEAAALLKNGRSHVACLALCCAVGPFYNALAFYKFHCYEVLGISLKLWSDAGSICNFVKLHLCIQIFSISVNPPYFQSVSLFINSCSYYKADAALAYDGQSVYNSSTAKRNRGDAKRPHFRSTS